MIYQQRLKQIIDLEFDKELSIRKSGDLEIFVYRPSIPPKRFKDYDPKRNLQIWLREGSRQFKPNHLRTMIDLYLRVRSRPDLKIQLAQAIDSIFYGLDPNEVSKSLDKEKFEHFLNPISITFHLSQLFLIEQEYGYNKASRYDPPTLFYQGWSRQILDTDKEIDNILMSITNRNTPAVKYTYADDKNHKKYTGNLQPIWWLE